MITKAIFSTICRFGQQDSPKQGPGGRGGPPGPPSGLTLRREFPYTWGLGKSIVKERLMSQQPYVPEKTEMREFTLRAVILRVVMTVILGAANAYLALRAG